MMNRRRVLGLLTSCAIGALGYVLTSAIPVRGLGQTQVITATAPLPLPPAEPGATAASSAPAADLFAPTIPESRRVTLEFPSWIRTGDSEGMRLMLETGSPGKVTPSARQLESPAEGATVQPPNVFQTHNVIAQAELDLAGVDIRPSEAVSEPLLPGETVTFRWSVHPTEVGTYQGTVWLFLVFVDKTTKEVSRRPLSAQTVQIECTSLLGLDGNSARLVGGLGAIAAVLVGLPFVDDVLRWMTTKVRRRSH